MTAIFHLTELECKGNSNRTENDCRAQGPRPGSSGLRGGFIFQLIGRTTTTVQFLTHKILCQAPLKKSKRNHSRTSESVPDATKFPEIMFKRDGLTLVFGMKLDNMYNM